VNAPQVRVIEIVNLSNHPNNNPGQKAGQTTPIGRDELRISIFDSFEEVRSKWEHIETHGDCYVFQSYRWLSHWYSCIGKQSGIAVCIVLVESREKLPLMLLPLGRRRSSFGSTLVWLGSALTDYRGPLLAKSYYGLVNEPLFAQVWEEIKQKLPECDAVFLEQQPEYIGTQPNPFVNASCRPHPSNAHFCNLPGTFETFLKDKRSTRWLSTERRKERRLADHGELELVIAKTREQVEELLPTLIRQKSRSYRELGVADIFDEPGYLEFVRQLSEKYAQSSLVLLCALMVGDKISTTFWGLVFQKRLYYLLPAYENDELAKYSPGSILLRRLFDWSFKNDVAVFDFTVGDEPYKFLWRDGEMRLYDYFESTTVRGFAYIALLGAARRMKRAIKTTPWLWKWVQALRARRLPHG
jgi:CelD/BcsL family acetyltransferase involved in cellulose biosynthesis